MSSDADTSRLKRATDALASYVSIYRVALWINAVLLVIYLFWALTASDYVFTYLLPAGHPGALTSQRWSGDFFTTGSLAALFVLILSGAEVAARPTQGKGLGIHLILLLLWFLYYLCVICFVWSFTLAKANAPEAGNAMNPANDPRYCCVNFNLGGCPNSPNPSASPALAGYGCTPGLGQADLIPNGVYLFKFAGLLIALVFMLIDGIYAGFILRGAVREVEAAIKSTLPATSGPVIAPPEGGYVIDNTQQMQPAQAASGIRSSLRSATPKPMLLSAPRHQQQAREAAHRVQAPLTVPKLSVRII